MIKSISIKQLIYVYTTANVYLYRCHPVCQYNTVWKIRQVPTFNSLNEFYDFMTIFYTGVVLLKFPWEIICVLKTITCYFNRG